MDLTHLNEKGEASMVDIGEKASTHRRAVATASIPFAPFSRSDKLGRIADWTRNPGHPGAHAAAWRNLPFPRRSSCKIWLNRAYPARNWDKP